MSPTRRFNAWPLAAQLKSFALASPPCRALSRASESCSAVHIASAISSASPGDTSASAAFPHTSGKDVTLDAMTGTPQAMASNTGMPNPSNQGTNTSASAAPNHLGQFVVRQAAQTVNALANQRRHIHGQLVPHGRTHDDQVTKPAPVHIPLKRRQQTFHVLARMQGPHKHEIPGSSCVSLADILRGRIGEGRERVVGGVGHD